MDNFYDKLNRHIDKSYAEWADKNDELGIAAMGGDTTSDSDQERQGAQLPVVIFDGPTIKTTYSDKRLGPVLSGSWRYDETLQRMVKIKVDAGRNNRR